MRSKRLVNVYDETDGVRCELCDAHNDGGKRLIHAEKVDGLTIIQQQDYCDECLDGLARLVISRAPVSDLDVWEQLIWEAKQDRLREKQLES